MAKVFISHSSKDKAVARRLVEDLRRLGHEPWLDEWQISVGECIVTKVSEGLDGCDFVILLMSPSSVASGWVEKEWKQAYWSEIERKKVTVLPVLIEDCPVPTLLRTKKYADCRGDQYTVGFVELAKAMGAPLIPSSPAIGSSTLPPSGDGRVLSLIAKLQTRHDPVSTHITEALLLARELRNDELRLFCEHEIKGYPHTADDRRITETAPAHRVMLTYMAADSELNQEFVGWGGDMNNAIAYMDQNPEVFRKVKSYVQKPIAELEHSALKAKERPTAIAYWTVPMGHFVPEAASPDHPIHCYARGDAFADLVEKIRQHLVELLMSLLPAVENGSPPV